MPLIFFGLRHMWPKRSLIEIAVLCVLLSATLPVANSSLTYNVLNAEVKHYETLMMGDEVAKISLLAGEGDLMPWVKPEDNSFCSPLPILYERAMCFVSRGYDPSGSLFVGMSHATARDLWIKSILGHPLQYLQVKLEAFLYFLRSPMQEPYYAWQNGIIENDLGIQLDNPQLAILMRAYVDGSQGALIVSEFFKPYAWLLLAMAMVLVGYRMSPSLARTQVLALNASSLGYFLGYMAGVPSADFRYVYWCIIATSLSVIVWLVAYAAARSEANRSPTLC